MGRPSAITAGGDLVGRVPGGAAPPRVTEGLVCADWAPPARRRGQGGGGLPMRKQGAGGAWLNRCGCGCVWRRIPGRGPRCRSRAVRPRFRFSGQLVPSGVVVGPSRLSARLRGTAQPRRALVSVPPRRLHERPQSEFDCGSCGPRKITAIWFAFQGGHAALDDHRHDCLRVLVGCARLICAQSGAKENFSRFFF